MIKAIFFDLDGTLVNTERLKAISYAKAAIELHPQSIQEEDVIEVFKRVVGLTRREVSTFLMERFGFEDEARYRMAEFGVSSPWQAFAQIRLKIYESMLADPNVLRANIWLHNMDLLKEVKRMGFKVALATMSHCKQVRHILKVLNLTDTFDFIATIDDIENGKPNPEIYLLLANELSVQPSDCLVIEDSLPGVKAAIAAGMWWIAVTTPFTRSVINSERLLDKRWIVDDPNCVKKVVDLMLIERKTD
jgi:HAD superfamily hydrolase (TIGR01509 family)